jgi:MraZ protein
MSHFLGTHQNRLDAKGRLSVPAPFRAALRAMSKDPDAPLVVLRPSHQHDCIEGWPYALFQTLTNPLDRLDLFSPAHNDMATTLFADAWPLEADGQGRIVLPDMLAQHAGLTETVEFMGLGRIFEIWEPAAAARRRAEARGNARANGLTLPGAAA